MHVPINIFFVLCTVLYTSWKWNQLHKAGRLCIGCREGDIQSVEASLNQGASVNVTDNVKNTPLHYAAENGHQAIVALLLSKGAIVDSKNTAGETSLHQAAAQGHQAAAEMLLNKDANVNETDHKGNTPLHFAAANKHQTIVEMLLNKDANVNEADPKDSTALHFAAYWGHQAIVALLLSKGAIVDYKNQDGRTSLHWATSKGHQAIVEMFLNKDANVNEADHKGNTPLHFAACEGHRIIGEILLNRGAIIDVYTQSGRTPLHASAFWGHQSMVEMLLSRGARLHVEDEVQHTPLTDAIVRNPRMLQLLLQKGAYSYHHRLSDQFLKNYYWNNVTGDVEAAKLWYTTLLLVGANPKEQILPEWLQPVQSAVVTTVESWLKPLNLSHAECREITPHVLRALPRLIHWLDLIHQADKERDTHEEKLKEWHPTLEDQMIGLKHLFLIPKTEQSDRVLVLQALQARAIPLELLVLIREKLIVRMLADTLSTVYSLPYQVAHYLATEGKTHHKEYMAFYEQLFTHDWGAPCSPPTTNHTIQHKHALHF